jgi:hypothetical protein
MNSKIDDPHETFYFFAILNQKDYPVPTPPFLLDDSSNQVVDDSNIPIIGT